LTETLKSRRERRDKKQLQSGGLFPDAQKMIEKVTHSITESSYETACYYKNHGIFQRIARSTAFETSTLLVILLNVLWISYDVDYNPSPTLADSSLLFKGVSQAFCFFFVAELLIRFLAFRHKLNWFRDFWCIFESVIVVLMLFELYVQSSLVHGLRLLRGLRLVRLVRLGLIFKYCNELTTVVRGISSAVRAIAVVFFLLTVMIYFCGVGFRIILEGTELGSAKFGTVPRAMGTLLLDCTLSGTKGVPVIKAAYKEGVFYAFSLLLFVLASAITLMGVLTGLLVQTVKTVADVEKEEQAVRQMSVEIDEMWEYISNDATSDTFVSTLELQLLSEDPELREMLRGMDIDPNHLRNVSDFVLEEHGLRMSLPQFKRVLLDLRGKNTAKVRDHVETRRFIRTQLQRAFLLPEQRGSTHGIDLATAARANKGSYAPLPAELSSSETDSETESDM